MARHQHRFLFTIPNGQTTSNEFKGNLAKVAFGSSVEALIYGPATLTGTVTVQVAPTDNPAGGDYAALQDGDTAADVTVTAAKAKRIRYTGGIEAMRLVSTLAEGADRLIWIVIEIEDSFGGVI